MDREAYVSASHKMRQVFSSFRHIRVLSSLLPATRLPRVASVMLTLRRRISDAASPAAWKVMRRASSAFQRTPTALSLADEGDWFYAREWWGDKVEGHEVFRADSEKGNGVVSVVAYSSSRPDPVQWPAVESWLQQRYMKLHPGCEDSGRFRILGYQWRTLRFNDNTRQSTVKVMAAYRLSDPGFVYIMQQPHCLSVPYLKSMISAGLTTLGCCPYKFGGIGEERPLHVLCVGHGGGSLPLFLASKLPGAVVHVVEIDPVVISASVQAMGFPASVIRQASESSEFDLSTNLLWGRIHQKLFLYESDAENFLLREPTMYDLIFIDAYDGDDIFPHKLWDPNGPFLEALGRHLHPKHGTVVVNLHSDSDVLSEDESASPLHHVLPMGKYVSLVCKAYKTALLGDGGLGLAYTVSVPWLCNISLVVSRGIIHRGDRNTIVNNLCSKAIAVENALRLPFSCLQYMKRRIVMV